MTQDGLKRIILDVDPGVDDIYALLALLFAVKLGRAKIEAITITHGNGPLPDVTKNVVRILEILGETNIPIYAGASEPLINSESPFIPNHFGKDGFCDIPHEKEPNITIVQNKVASIAINDIVMQNPKEISIICLGPLTNIALTTKLFRNFFDNVKEVFIFGGNIQAFGNTPTTSEFNFFMDPEAANIVLRSVRCPVTILSYETVINYAMTMNWRINELGAIDCPIMNLLNKVEKILRVTKNYLRDKWTPFDLYLTTSALFPDEIVTETQAFHVSVELVGTLTRGQMVLDHRHKKLPNVSIITKIKIEALKKFLFEMMELYASYKK